MSNDKSLLTLQKNHLGPKGFWRGTPFNLQTYSCNVLFIIKYNNIDQMLKRNLMKYSY